MLLKKLKPRGTAIGGGIARVLVLSVLAAFVPTGQAHAEKYKSISIGSWKGGVYTSKTTGNFSHCAMSASYKSGIILYFAVTRTYNWKVGFSKNSWNLDIGKKYSLRYQVDRHKVFSGDARAVTKVLAIIDLPATTGLFNQMRRGRLLKVKTGDDLLKFKLTGTNKMLSKLLRCAKRYNTLSVGAPVVSKNTDNPFDGKKTAQKQAPPVRSDGLPEAYYSEASQWLGKTMQNSGIDYKVVPNAGKAAKSYKKHAVIWRIGKKTGIIGTLRIFSKIAPQTLSTNVLAHEARICKGSFASRFLEQDDIGSKKIFRLLTTCLKADGKERTAHFSATARKRGGSYLVTILSTRASAETVLQAGEQMAGSMRMADSKVPEPATSTDFGEEELPLNDSGGKVVGF